MRQVTTKQLEGRVRRAIRRDDEFHRLRVSRSERMARDFGWFWVHDMSRNTPVATHCSLTGLAEEYGCLRPWEEVAP